MSFRAGCLTLFPTLLLLPTFALAQTLSLGAALSAPGGPYLEASADNLAAGRDRVSVSVTGGAGVPLRVAAQARSTRSFGPAGNVVFRGLASLGAASRFEMGVHVQGVLGPVAGAAGFTVFGSGARPADPFAQDRFRWLEPTRSDAGVMLELLASYRASRDLILTGEPSLLWSAAGGPGGRLAAEGRWVRLFDPDDLRLLLDTEWHAGRGHGALGLEYDVNRRDWPDLRASLWVGAGWLGAGSAGLWPGARVAATVTAEGVRYRFAVAAEPYRVNPAPYRVETSAEVPVQGGVLTPYADARLGRGLAARLGLRYAFSF